MRILFFVLLLVGTAFCRDCYICEGSFEQKGCFANELTDDLLITCAAEEMYCQTFIKATGSWFSASSVTSVVRKCSGTFQTSSSIVNDQTALLSSCSSDGCNNDGPSRRTSEATATVPPTPVPTTTTTTQSPILSCYVCTGQEESSCENDLTSNLQQCPDGTTNCYSKIEWMGTGQKDIQRSCMNSTTSCQKDCNNKADGSGLCTQICSAVALLDLYACNDMNAEPGELASSAPDIKAAVAFISAITLLLASYLV